jgi:putative sporulation protein YtxC
MCFTEGLVNVHALHITTQLAFPSLVSKLESIGWRVTVTNELEIGTWIQVCAPHVEELAELLCTFAFEDWMCSYLDGRLAKGHSYLHEDEKEYLVLVMLHSIKTGSRTYAGHTFEEWKQVVLKTFHEMLNAAQPIDMEGVLRFRLKGFLESVSGQLEDDVQQFLADREYEEFVSMLRYILESQTQTSQVMHVYCSQERVWICDAEGELVRDTDVAKAVELASDGEDMNAEDLAMSILITRSPSEIIIHDLFPDAAWPSFPETVEKVFSGRAKKCGGCSTCARLQQVSFRLYPFC